MLSYPIDEAEQMLGSKLNAAKASLANCEEDLDFLREQITVSLTEGYRISSCITNSKLDNGGSCRTSLQLGCRAEAKGEGRRR